MRLTKRARIDREARVFSTDACYHRWDGETLEMLLPWPPSNNVYYRSRVVFKRVGKPFVTTYIGADGDAYVKAVAAILAGVHSFGTARLRVCVVLHGPTRQRRDVKNFDKALCDSMNGLVYADDSQIDDFRVVRGRHRPGGAVLVRIREMAPLLPEWTAGKLFEDVADE